MSNSKKITLIGMLVLPSMLVGCNGIGKDDNVEVVEEWVVAEEESENDTSKKDDENKLEENINSNSKEEDSKEVTNDAIKKEETKNNSDNSIDKEELKDKEEIKKEESISDNITLVENPVFTKSEITESLKSRMRGKSMPEDANMSFDELSYLTITYLDYEGQTRQGEMIVNKKLADEVLEIFREIYNAKFPIQRMNLIDDYGASDHSSMVNNNSSAFCYRTIAGTNKISNHGKGVAIDINPFYNPHVLKSSGKVNPPEASKYANRSLSAKGMIKYNDVVYKAFTSRGWKWGGHWNNPDYQHFEKSI